MTSEDVKQAIIELQNQVKNLEQGQEQLRDIPVVAAAAQVSLEEIYDIKKELLTTTHEKVTEIVDAFEKVVLQVKEISEKTLEKQ